MSTVTVNSAAEISQHIKLDLFKKFTVNKWLKLGDLVAKWIKHDLVKGILQGIKETDYYRSRQYIKYKKNQMRRFTDGKRLESHYNLPIQSTETGKVNLILTGKMKDSLRARPELTDNKGVGIGVDARHAGKVIGNRELGREFLTLNENNQKKALDWIINNMIDPALKEFARGNINVNVKI